MALVEQQQQQPYRGDPFQQLRDYVASDSTEPGAGPATPPPIRGLCSIAKVESGPLAGVYCMRGQEAALQVCGCVWH